MKVYYAHSKKTYNTEIEEKELGFLREMYEMMDDYMSLIRGGHNFSVISTSPNWISSHYMNANLVVNFDKRSCETHINDKAENGILIFNSDEQELEFLDYVEILN